LIAARDGVEWPDFEVLAAHLRQAVAEVLRERLAGVGKTSFRAGIASIVERQNRDGFDEFGVFRWTAGIGRLAAAREEVRRGTDYSDEQQGRPDADEKPRARAG